MWGTLKVRGTKEQLKDFILNGLGWVSANGVDARDVQLDRYGCIEYGYGYLSIKETRKCFVENYSDVCLEDFKEGETGVILLDMETTYYISGKQLQEISKQYGIDLKICAFDKGMECGQDIEIVGGEIVKDDEITFADFLWECPCPLLGG